MSALMAAPASVFPGAIYTDEYSQGTNVSVAGTNIWGLPFNTEKRNLIGLSYDDPTRQFTFPAGEYFVEMSTYFGHFGDSHFQVYDVTNGATLDVMATFEGSANSWTTLHAYFDLPAEINLVFAAFSTSSSDRFGNDANLSLAGDEIYRRLHVWRS